MTMVLLPIAICLIGLVLYSVATAAKAQEIGRTMFAVGLLASLLGPGVALVLR